MSGSIRPLAEIRPSSRTYTATAIMALAEAGEVGLDDPVRAASYNSAAYVLAGRLIEKVPGQPYEAAIKRLIL